ncbi:MAG: twitching motility protein [Candidatus Fischerbacteria bacterium RBG_13_37_8]|uniref:Twitching motility protein n=1 Tax=Candidatus Fischerbacteria bacterium RBG_13_37_8 TaxID=1817863 RepID=A0A1F5V825_9BACT|nr:MAG: twitching motility protein [Candidatus Fischerbacteria bacterium RBG_13_37_8]
MAQFELPRILELLLKTHKSISDINFSVGRPPQVTIDGSLNPVAIKGLEMLSPFHTEAISLNMIGKNKMAMRALIEHGSADLSYSLPGITRFRVNIFSQRGTYSIVLRVIPAGIPTIDALNLPPVLHSIQNEKTGLVLVTGPTGSGKSTTLAAILNEINENKAYHIITIEDPIEYLHRHKKSTINQRELGGDTPNFAVALRASLRQAPNVILVGEMRDLETTEIALEAAETGHLVLSTLHTIDAARTVDRIIGLYPKGDERQIRMRLSQTFKYIISQRLIPKKGGGRIAVIEVLKSNQRTREYILEGEKSGKSLTDAMIDGSLEGMQTFDSVLINLIINNIITKEVGVSYATNPGNLMLRLDGLGDGDEFRKPAVAKETKESVPDWLE